jgi:HAD superfamily hydrolase (TIGR01549 family)
MTIFQDIRGVLFDLDGTLVDSALDFQQMRREMGLAEGAPILETIAHLPAHQADRCREVLDRHEAAGALRATVMPGARELLALLDARGIRRAVVTRNARPLAIATLRRLSIEFDLVVAREDGPIKPDPSAIWKICETWGLVPSQVLVVGDFFYDMEMGRRAGSPTVLFTAGREPQAVRGHELADHIVRSLDELCPLLERQIAANPANSERKST